MEEVLNTTDKFIQENSPDGGFLQSEEWRKFQKSVGRKTFCISSGEFYASIIEHQLPIVGKYFYIPRGPIMTHNPQPTTHNQISDLIDLANRENIGWIRFDANNSHILDLIRKNWRVVEAPHDMQPREILTLDITKPEEQLLAEMKSKTRYNIRLAEKKGVSLRITNSYETTNNRDIEEFLKLVKVTAKRDKITPHPENYYRKMFETIPGDILKLYVAEYEGKIIAANIMIFYGNTATYFHGASNNEYRSVMAPHLLQWRAIQNAKKAGFTRYDLGGVKLCNMQCAGCNNDWSGITRFKTSFSPNTQPVKFPGSYDIVINSFKYNLYRVLQRLKNII